MEVQVLEVLVSGVHWLLTSTPCSLVLALSAADLGKVKFKEEELGWFKASCRFESQDLGL